MTIEDIKRISFENLRQAKLELNRKGYLVGRDDAASDGKRTLIVKIEQLRVRYGQKLKTVPVIGWFIRKIYLMVSDDHDSNFILRTVRKILKRSR